VGLDPEDALAHVGQAIWYQQHQRDEAASQAWIRAWELDPENQSIRRALVRLTGDLPESPLAEAVAMLRPGLEDHAVESLRRVVNEHSDPAASLGLLTALWASGAQREAFSLAVNLHNQQPFSVKATLYVAALEDRHGRTLRSRELIARAEQVDPGLMLFGDVVRYVGLQPALELHRASRPVAVVR
jgi:hypothetical protein